MIKISCIYKTNITFITALLLMISFHGNGGEWLTQVYGGNGWTNNHEKQMERKYLLLTQLWLEFPFVFSPTFLVTTKKRPISLEKSKKLLYYPYPIISPILKRSASFFWRAVMEFNVKREISPFEPSL